MKNIFLNFNHNTYRNAFTFNKLVLDGMFSAFFSIYQLNHYSSSASTNSIAPFINIKELTKQLPDIIKNNKVVLNELIDML